jgi:hypothetical protein
VSWWGNRTRVVAEWDREGLDDAVNRARQDYQHARYLMEISEPDGRVEDAIYYLQLTEKRYMYLLAQAKQERSRTKEREGCAWRRNG